MGTARFEPATSCLQSQIGQNRCHLRGWGPALVERAAALSMIDRSAPVETAVNGTLVARPLRTTPSNPSYLWFHPDRTVRPILGGHCLVGKSLEGLAAAGWGRVELRPASLVLPGRSLAGPFACGFSYLWRPLSPLHSPTHRYGVYLAWTNHSGLIR